MYQVLVIICIYIFCIHAIPISEKKIVNNQENVSQDCKVLADIYKYFNLPTPYFAQNELNMLNCCSYEVRRMGTSNGIAITEWMCEPEENNRITTIILKEKNISTDIPWDLFSKLEKLEILHLYNNNIIGNIEGNLKDALPNLKYLRLQNNNLSGYLPTYLPDSLIDINLTDNENIKDSIPVEWSNNNKLKCYVSNNICKPTSNTKSCYLGISTSNTRICQDGEDDRSEAHKMLTKDKNKDNNNSNNNNKINDNDNDNDNTKKTKIEENEENQTSNAVWILTGFIVGLLLIILVIMIFLSYFSKKKAVEKEKDIYSNNNENDEENDRTEASIFYSRRLNTENENSNEDIEDYDEMSNLNTNNSISIFANVDNGENQDQDINNSVVKTSSKNKIKQNNKVIPEEEISFIEKVEPCQAIQSPNISLSDITMEDDDINTSNIMQSP